MHEGVPKGVIWTGEPVSHGCEERLNAAVGKCSDYYSTLLHGRCVMHSLTEFNS